MMLILQGLELAADCHLARITQTAHLLQVREMIPSTDKVEEGRAEGQHTLAAMS
jgi:hypothetical protein